MSLIVSLFFSYGVKSITTLTQLRHTKFMEIIATCYALNPEILPPSERATYYHSLRVHLQVSQWKQLDIHIVPADEWVFGSSA